MDKNQKKKVFIMAYARANLGDDLFIVMLLSRHPELDFYLKVPNYEFVEKLSKYKNLNILIGPDTDDELYAMNEDDYDAYVYAGGSIFMEGGHVYNLSENFYDFVKRCKQKGKPFCYISSNYGPFYTQEYFDLSRKDFNTCTDICFRDKYSYEMFKDIKSVRYAPDYAFTYPLNDSKKQPNTVGISIINLGIRNEFVNLRQDYFDMMRNNIQKYIESRKKVYLFSYCDHEGDAEIVRQLVDYFNNDSVIGVYYDGNIEEFLKIYSGMEYMICGRFHSMILSAVAKQKMLVISYSKKIDRVAEDLELDLPSIDLHDIKPNMNLDLSSFRAVDSKKLEKIKKDAQKQSLVFDKSVASILEKEKMKA